MLRAVTRVCLVALLGLAAPGLSAQEAPASDPAAAAEPLVASATTSGGLELSADLRSSYLSGQDLLITLRVDNREDEPLEFPRLDERPHLVSFVLRSSAGRKETRSTPAPDEDEDLRWVLPPRGTRQVSLQLPSGATLRPGPYQLSLRVQAEDETLTLGPVEVTLDPPAPSAADLGAGGEGVALLGWQSPWVHAGKAGHQLYLHTMDNRAPGARGYHWYLTELDQAVQPWLSSSRATESASRYLYWIDGRSLVFARLEGHSLRHQPRLVTLPYPRWELLGRGGSDPSGGLHVPVWIPAPSGEAGEVRVVSVDPRGQPRFRKVVGMDTVPSSASWIDGAGQLRLLLLHEGKLDLYTVGTGEDATAPVTGRRLIPRPLREGEVQIAAPERRGGSGTGALVSDHIAGFVMRHLSPLDPPPVLGVRFGVLPERGDHAGGTAVFAWLGDHQREGARVVGVWMALDGRVVASVPGMMLPDGHELVQVLPRGHDAMVLVTRDGRGEAWAHCADWDGAQPLGERGPHDALRFDPEGRLWSHRVVAGRGLVAEPVGP
jgi:hypothetical protein